MNVELTTIAANDYVREVLPLSRVLWANGRSDEEYAGDFHRIARSAYGRRRFSTVGIRAEATIAASCKRYERELRCGDRSLRAVGIGAVFTAPAFRGRGYASALLGALLDAERVAGTDVAYLFSDIHPLFYERLGFISLPSRSITLRVDMLPATRLDVAAATDNDWPTIRRCFDALNNRRPIALTRTPVVWEWLRTAARTRRDQGQPVELIVRGSRGARAYVWGRRFPKLDAFVMDEFGYTGDDGCDAVGPLLRSAAGDLRKITGWLPPDLARRALPRGAVRRRKHGVLMIAVISPSARAAWRIRSDEILGDDADRLWSTDHV